MIYIKKRDEVEMVRKSAEILKRVFEKVDSFIKPGLKSKELDEFIGDSIWEMGAKPAFLNYRGFPASSCISINEEVVHGIPDDRRLKQEDLVKVDVGVNFMGYFSDAAKTYYLSDSDDLDINRLISGTKLALLNGMKALKDGVHVGDIAAVIEGTAKRFRLGVIKVLGGHGVGLHLHEEPFLPNYGRPGSGPVLYENVIIAIEPMFTLGYGDVFERENGWTMVTRDGSYAAHYEETVLITKDGFENLTKVVYG
ncbi:MAG TPA: type I methionyl aminopeptidase [Candidatus Hydrothermia bacterium]|nr:type I methionyl aminopeptidase [Candidatus Hydrothermae bacterium]MDD3648946.1 type I methionyl aminopeptidase [Candidatus Hydrothermia bacterium]MDD5573456.1 type I methionyl aminopeptidase [Candidatus Hydrothermia bacterium]HOK23187.1 type I methionyl aminopeptidase [Candidatus Hydrothermia bacterium]HOL23891.1 type I methionyl aminopeptidase [Candidatus Hydrothermia bacterium]